LKYLGGINNLNSTRSLGSFNIKILLLASRKGDNSIG